jgi:hypothetical protein
VNTNVDTLAKSKEKALIAAEKLQMKTIQLLIANMPLTASELKKRKNNVYADY